MHLQLSHVLPAATGSTALPRASSLDMGTLRAIYCEMKMKHVQSLVLYGAIHLLPLLSDPTPCPTEVLSLSLHTLSLFPATHTDVLPACEF